MLRSTDYTSAADTRCPVGEASNDKARQHLDKSWTRGYGQFIHYSATLASNAASAYSRAVSALLAHYDQGLLPRRFFAVQSDGIDA